MLQFVEAFYYCEINTLTLRSSKSDDATTTSAKVLEKDHDTSDSGGNGGCYGK